MYSNSSLKNKPTTKEYAKSKLQTITGLIQAHELRTLRHRVHTLLIHK